MKKRQYTQFLPACLASALLVLSVSATAEEPEAEYIKTNRSGQKPAMFWTIPPVNQRWGIPTSTRERALTPADGEWTTPAQSHHWTIPRSGTELRQDTRK